MSMARPMEGCLEAEEEEESFMVQGDGGNGRPEWNGRPEINIDAPNGMGAPKSILAPQNEY